MNDDFIIRQKPTWLKYPESYARIIIEADGHDFLPWYFTIEEASSWTEKDLKKRYPNRNLFCFARKDGTDDIACWERGYGEKVFIIHDFASPGWEQRQIFSNFDEWYAWALNQKDKIPTGGISYQSQETQISSQLENEFFTMELADQGQILNFNMNSKGIDLILSSLSINKETYLINEKNTLNFPAKNGYVNINTLVIKNILEDNHDGMILNYSSSEEILYMFINDSSLQYFKLCLESLKDNIGNRKTERVICMPPEWGDYGLITEQVIEGSNVIFYLKLCGIF